MDPSVFRCIVPDPNNSSIMWIAGLSGLFSFDRNTQLLKHHPHPIDIFIDYGNKIFLPQHKQYLVTKIIIADGSIFLSAWGGGLMEYSLSDSIWTKYTFEPYTPKMILDENIVHSIIEYDDKIFFGAVPMMGFIDLKNRSIHTKNNSVNKNRKNFFAVLKDKNNVLWWSTFANGIYTMKIPTKEYKPTSTSSLVINSIFLDDKQIYTLHKDKLSDTISILPKHNHISIKGKP
jgi:hypothetical protein